MKRQKNTRLVSLALIVLLLGMFSLAQGQNAVAQETSVYTVRVEGTVTNATTNLIRRGLEVAAENDAEAFVILLDTPGGLVTSTLDIIQDVLNATVPVITYVAPQGAIAASAGTFILLTGNISAMAPGTTCGAAMPVMMSAEGGAQSADEKTINFLAGHIGSVAQERGRPVDVARRFVTENLTLDSREALEAGVVDHIAPTLEQLLVAVDGMEVTVGGETKALKTNSARIEPLENNLVESFTGIISDPQVSVILLMLGVYGLIIGFGAPESFFPEVLGAISLLLGLYGLGTFEVNIFAALMIVLGILLLVAEALTPSIGVLAVGGIISMVLGIIFLPSEPLMPSSWLFRFRFFAGGIGVGSAVVMVILLRGVMRLRRSKVLMGSDEFNEVEAMVVEDLTPTGQVKIRGEIWEAESQDKSIIPMGSCVRVVDRDNLRVIVVEVRSAEVLEEEEE